jgi:isocitrate dehydrogenase
MPTKTPITVAHGDGIGPEIMNATLQILEAAGAALDIETIEIGEKVYLRGNTPA